MCNIVGLYSMYLLYIVTYNIIQHIPHRIYNQIVNVFHAYDFFYNCILGLLYIMLQWITLLAVLKVEKLLGPWVLIAWILKTYLAKLNKAAWNGHENNGFRS